MHLVIAEGCFPVHVSEKACLPTIPMCKKWLEGANYAQYGMIFSGKSARSSMHSLYYRTELGQWKRIKK